MGEGIGSIGGAVYGAIFVALLNNSLRIAGIPSLYQEMIVGVLIIAAMAFENYFKCPNKRMAREMYARLSGTIYASMENFPSYQSDKEIRWIEGDVTIVTYIDERKDDAGYYTVVIRRYNNTVMNQ